MSSPVHDFFKLVLAGLTKFVSDCIKETLRISEIILEIGLEFLIYNEHSNTALNLLIMLLLVI